MLKTASCLLTSLEQSDYEDVKELFTCHDVRKYLGGVIETNQYDRKFANMLAANDEWTFTIRRLDNMAFVGLISLNEHQDGIGTEISYQLVRKEWKKGYAREAVLKIIEFATVTLGIQAIVAETQSANINSCKLLERAGMSLVKKVTRFGEEQSIYSLIVSQ